MALSSIDIVFYYSAQATGPTNNTLSLGGTISATGTITDNLANNIFDDVTGDESAAGDTEYRGIYIKDTNSAYSMINPKIWILGYRRDPTNPDTISIACSTFILGGNAMGSCATESAAPNETAGSIIWVVESAVSSITPSNTIGFNAASIATTIAASIAAANTTLPPLSYFGLWIKRDVPVTASPFTDRSCTIKVQCETTASPFTHTVERVYVLSFNKGGALSVIQ